MSNLKTLKDIEEIYDSPNNKSIDIMKCVEVDVLRQAAREWVKYMKNLKGDKLRYAEPTILWIEGFFNLEDE